MILFHRKSGHDVRTIGLGRLALRKVVDQYRFDPSLRQQLNQSDHTPGEPEGRRRAPTHGQRHQP
jgi:hypothetical protein